MMKEIATISITILIIAAILNTIYLCLSPKKSMFFTIVIYFLVSIAIIMADLAMERFGVINIHLFRALYSVLFFFPFIILLFSDFFFRKLFVFFLANISTTTILALIKILALLVTPGPESGSGFRFWLAMLALSVPMYAVHIFVVRKFGARLVDRLFTYGSKKEWALYSLGIGIYFFIVEMLYPFLDRHLLAGFVALFVVWWSIIILCYAIINAQEKAKKEYEVEFTKGIITTSRDHYKKMNEQYNAIRIMKHDYKFHLNTALSMLRKGEIEKSGEYLNGLQTQLQEGELPHFCDNPVINSLISDYALRCKKSDIELEIQISIPDSFSVPNYEMCIVLGNLLENAVEACQKLNVNRKIELTVKPQGEQLAIMARNTFDGKIAKDGENLISMKKEGGIGLQSVKAVAERYCERFVTEHDTQWFSVFVLWKKGVDNNER
ncbi:MAG: GHKL domain-containing protein [Treponema sp.]|jgi:hypothetical protein|nr:GHKL domain-containing protein [Treponema sp.]